MSDAPSALGLWREASGLRWVTVTAALLAGLGLVGEPWRDASTRVAPAGHATFESQSVPPPAPTAATTTAGPAHVSPQAQSGNAADVLPSPAARAAAPTVVRPAAPDRTPAHPKQATSTTTWATSADQPVVVSGGGLVASARGGGTHTAIASRAVTEGRHYLELTLSVPPGDGGPSTWGALGVVPTAGLTHGRVFLPRGTGGLAVPTGKGRKLQDGDIVMLAIDANERVAFWGVNGEWMNGVPGAQGGQPLQGNAGDQVTPFVNVTGADRSRVPPEGGEQWIANFGAAPFRYAMPGGYDSYGSLSALSQRAKSVRPGDSAAVSPVPAPLPPDAMMGKRFSDVVRVQDQAIPLPKGSWTVLAHFRDPGTSASRGDTIVLGRIEGTKLLGMVAINAKKSAAGAPPFEACNRGSYVFRQVDSVDANDGQRCWWINHAVGVWQTQPPFQAAQLELARLGVSAPQVMLNVGMRRADATGFATTFYYFDPAIEGIASSPGNWADSEWHRSRIDGDPARRAYVQKLQRWGETWAPIYYVSK